MQNDDLVSAVRRALKQLDDDLGGPATHDEQARAIIPLVLEHAAGVADTKKRHPEYVKRAFGNGDEGPMWFNEGIKEAASAIRGAA